MNENESLSHSVKKAVRGFCGAIILFIGVIAVIGFIISPKTENLVFLIGGLVFLSAGKDAMEYNDCWFEGGLIKNLKKKLGR